LDGKGNFVGVSRFVVVGWYDGQWSIGVVLKWGFGMGLWHV